jgi:ribonuclease HI
MFTDASRCPNTGIGGWAAWAKGDIAGSTRRMTASGPLKGLSVTSDHAEMMALVNGLYHVIGFYRPAHNTAVLAQTDSEAAISMFHSGSKHKEVVEVWRKLISSTGVRVKLCHVKAHQNGVTPRSWVNEWCDNAAKAHMRAKRDHWKTASVMKYPSVSATGCK